MTSLDLVDGRRGLWDVVDVILLLVTIPHGHLGVEWSFLFLLVYVVLGYGRVFFDVCGDNI